MKVTASAISLNVADVAASAAFVKKHFGFVESMVVEDKEYERLQTEGAPIVTPIETEPWGERYFQVQDPNGVIVQLVEWIQQP